MRETMEQNKASEGQPNEAQTLVPKHGGWITFPFLAGNVLGMGLAISGTTVDIIVYLVSKYNVSSIDAAQISSVINGCVSIAPVLGAIISDACFGCYPVVVFSSTIIFLSSVVFTLTATIPSLGPSPCPLGSDSCEPPSTAQFAVLYTAVGLLAIGNGGTRFNSAAMGANQFDKALDQEVFFNWFFVFYYAATILGTTAVVYVHENVSWAFGFGLCAAVSASSVFVLLLGSRYYKRPAAQGSPFVGLARVVVAAMRKRNVNLFDSGKVNSHRVALLEPARLEDHYYYGTADEAENVAIVPPSESFTFLNRAAVITDGDMHADGAVAKPWRLCTVQQVEDLKTLVRIFPLWSSAIVVSVSIGMQTSLTILQALTVDRSLGQFTVPAGSMSFSFVAAAAVSLALLDHLLFRFWRGPTPLHRIAIGYFLNTVGVAVSALVERKRMATVRVHHAEKQGGWIVPMSVLWFVLPLAVAGLGEALHFPGQVVLYYREFPKAMKSTATGVMALIIALGWYLSTAVIELVRRTTTWLPDNINESGLENVYWMLVVVGVINFGYYVVCAKYYKYQSTSESTETAGN